MTFKYTLGKMLLVTVATITLLSSASHSYAHSGPLNKLALEVCEKKERSQVCEYKVSHSHLGANYSELFIGTCQRLAATMLCVRNKPIQRIESTKTQPKTTETEKTETKVEQQATIQTPAK